MIFVTVGSQLPFDRMVHAVDAWAKRTGRTDVVAQVGTTDAPPATLQSVVSMSPSEFDAHIDRADVVVGHAGTGTIMAALTAGKPVVVLARREGLGETRNDHQVATVERFRGVDGFHGCVDIGELEGLLEAACEAAGDGSGSPTLGPHAGPELLGRLQSFFEESLR